MSLTRSQVNQLLKWINENRVVEANKHKHLAQQDVRAHLIRIFGFGNFDIEVLKLECILEEPFYDKKEKAVVDYKFNVLYQAIVQLTIRDPQGNLVCKYQDVSAANAQNQGKAEAHELAMKSAVSGAIKRCAINLGDQFGLSLYNRGQMSGIVKGTLVLPEGDNVIQDDIQNNIDKQESLGLDEDSVSADEGITIGSGKETPKLDRTKAEKIEYSEKVIATASACFDEISGFTDVDSLQE